MSPEEIGSRLETAYADPAACRSGNYLVDRVLEIAAQVPQQDRASLVDAVRAWLLSRTDDRTCIALIVIRELRLAELRPEVLGLLGEVEAGALFRPYYRFWFEEALRATR